VPWIVLPPAVNLPLKRWLKSRGEKSGEFLVSVHVSLLKVIAYTRTTPRESK
jgi:hypothetical protein